MPRPQEVPWDLADRCLLPVVFAHAAAVLVAFVLNTLGLSQISSISVFLLLVAVSIGVTLSYHNLKVTTAGKVVLVTGCDGRVGAAVARQLDEMGFTVFAVVSEPDSDVSRKLKDDCSGRLQLLRLDVASDDDVRAAREYVVEHGATNVWAVVNTASWAAFGEVEWASMETFRRAADVNLLGAVRVTRAFLPLLRRSKGRVVNVTSLLGRITAPFRAPHCAVTAAVEAFSDCLRLEMRRWGVDVVVVQPGDYTSGNTAFNNDAAVREQARKMWAAMPEDARADYGEDYFERRVRSLEEYTRGQEADLSPLVRSVADAVSRTFPLARYTPVTQAEKMRAFVADHLPRSVYDIVYN